MADKNPRQNLYLEISRNLVDEELTDLREYVSGAKILPAGFVQKANAHQICNQLEKEQKLKPGDLSLLADLLRKIGRSDFAEKAGKIADDERKGKKTRKKEKRERKRKREQPHEDDSSEESSSIRNDPHVGPGQGLDNSCLLKVAKEVAPSWVKFAVEQLALTAQDVVNIQLQHPSSTEHQAFQALELWRDRRGRKACRVKLAQALRRGGFQHAAELSVRQSPQGTQKQTLTSQDQTPVARSKRPKIGTDFADGELSVKGPSGGHVTHRRESGTREYKANSSNTDASSDENNDYFTLLRMSEDMFHPGNVTDPQKFKQAITQFEEQAETVIETDESEFEGPQLERKVKLRLKRGAKQRVRNVHETAFTKRVLRNLRLHNRILDCFKQFKAILRRLTRGCLLCYLEYDDMSCYRTFLAAYRDGRLSETLTRELITDDMRAAEGEDLYVHVTLLGEDGECQDDSLSDEEEPRGPTEGSKVGCTAPESLVFIKQEPLSPVKVEPPQELPSCSYSTEIQDSKAATDVSASDQPPGLKTEQINITPKEDVQNVGLGVKAEPHVLVETDELNQQRLVKSELDIQFAAIADNLGSMWERLASSLGFNTDYIRDLTARLPPSLRPHQLICDWMERNVGDVTLEQLVQALRNAGIHEVADAADSGQLFLTEADSEALKEKPDEDVNNANRADGRLSLKREFPDSSSSDSTSSSDDEDHHQASAGDAVC